MTLQVKRLHPRNRKPLPSMPQVRNGTGKDEDECGRCKKKVNWLVVLIFFIFIPIPGEMIQFDEHIFQRGWFNHLVKDATGTFKKFQTICRRLMFCLFLVDILWYISYIYILWSWSLPRVHFPVILVGFDYKKKQAKKRRCFSTKISSHPHDTLEATFNSSTTLTGWADSGGDGMEISWHKKKVRSVEFWRRFLGVHHKNQPLHGDFLGPLKIDR